MTETTGGMEFGPGVPRVMAPEIFGETSLVHLLDWRHEYYGPDDVVLKLIEAEQIAGGNIASVLPTHDERQITWDVFQELVRTPTPERAEAIAVEGEDLFERLQTVRQTEAWLLAESRGIASLAAGDLDPHEYDDFATTLWEISHPNAPGSDPHPDRSVEAYLRDRPMSTKDLAADMLNFADQFSDTIEQTLATYILANLSLLGTDGIDASVRDAWTEKLRQMSITDNASVHSLRRVVFQEIFDTSRKVTRDPSIGANTTIVGRLLNLNSIERAWRTETVEERTATHAIRDRLWPGVEGSEIVEHLHDISAFQAAKLEEHRLERLPTLSQVQKAGFRRDTVERIVERLGVDEATAFKVVEFTGMLRHYLYSEAAQSRGRDALALHTALAADYRKAYTWLAARGMPSDSAPPFYDGIESSWELVAHNWDAFSAVMSTARRGGRQLDMDALRNIILQLEEEVLPPESEAATDHGSSAVAEVVELSPEASERVTRFTEEARELGWDALPKSSGSDSSIRTEIARKTREAANDPERDPRRLEPLARIEEAFDGRSFKPRPGRLGTSSYYMTAIADASGVGHVVAISDRVGDGAYLLRDAPGLGSALELTVFNRRDVRESENIPWGRVTHPSVGDYDPDNFLLELMKELRALGFQSEFRFPGEPRPEE